MIPWRRPPRDCRHVARVLQHYLDGELDAEATRRVAAHLDECRRCGLDATTYREVKERLRRQRTVDGDALRRLQAFAEELASPADR